MRHAHIQLLLMFVPGVLLAQTLKDGMELYRSGKFVEAKSVLENIVKQDDENAEAHYWLGLVDLNRRYADRDFDEAADQMERAVELNPNNADYQFALGGAYGEKAQNSGLIKKAILAPKIKKAFLRAVELNPKHIQARVALAQYYFMAPSIMGGDEEEGWKQLDEVMKMDEFQGRVLKMVFLERNKKNSEAEDEVKKLVSSRPKDWRGWKNYGYFCVRAKRYDEAIAHFGKYVALRPDTADSFESLAEAQIAKGDNDGAITNLRKSLFIDKTFVPAIYYLGEAYQAKGQKKEAKETYQWVLAESKSGQYHDQAQKKLKELE